MFGNSNPRKIVLLKNLDVYGTILGCRWEWQYARATAHLPRQQKLFLGLYFVFNINFKYCIAGTIGGHENLAVWLQTGRSKNVGGI